MASLAFFATFGLLASNGAFAHPGHSHVEEAAERAQFLSMLPRSVGSCAAELQRRGHLEVGIARREALAAQYRAGHSDRQQRRDLQEHEHSHAANFVFPPDPTDERLLFTDNSSCVLTPEVDGLGHFIAGEQMRSDMSENQPGVPMKIEIQIVDTHSCQPIPDVYLELYQCNATGVYSGVQAEGNGNPADVSNLAATHGRGIQQTDSNGVATFETIFPGHYYGVANHIHIVTHSDSQPVAPSDDGRHFVQATHNGRIFFDQDLINTVEATAPYNGNQQQLTLNKDDWVLNEEAAVTDPYVRYVWLGQRPEDGLLAWISVGIDPSVVHPMEYVGKGQGGNGGAIKPSQ